MELEEQARELLRLKAEKDRTAKAAAKAKAEFDKAHQAMWDRMDATRVHNVGIDGRNLVYNKPKVYGNVTDKETLRRWAVDEGNAPHLFAEAPLEARINEFVRLAVDNGDPMPPGLNWYTKETVADRKARS